MPQPLSLEDNAAGRGDVKATLELINQMQADGVIADYAIGGAVAATIYVEPAATLDIDIFVTLPTTEKSPLISLAPIYQYLQARGCSVEREHILIGGWPVQFLPPSDCLQREALEEAVKVTIEGIATWVMTAEHLVAIALRTGRPKDCLRILQFIEQDAVNRNKLSDLLDRHGLRSRWQQFEAKYLEGEHGQKDS